MKLIAAILLTFAFGRIAAQTLGGNTVFSFLDLPGTPQLTALGGINNTALTNDVGLSFNDPALLRPAMHGEISASFSTLYDGISNYSCWAAMHSARWQTTFAAGVDYLDYGNATQTDATGNILGDFRPSDYVVQVAASRRYEKKWFYGLTLKFLHSAYGYYRSSGAALDIGLNYYDSAHLFQAGFTLRNMGIQLSPYPGTTRGDLPFDLSLGLTKRLAKAPLQFSLTAHHLQQFNIRYNDTTFNNYNGFDQNNKDASFTFDKLLRHFILAAQVFPEDRVEITVAYNYLRRKELNIGPAGNGFTGFSFGLGVLLKKLQLRYARGFYTNTTGYNQFGLDLRLND
ncbi:MAG: type IX secretion system protein PorQ [Chitinophagaceae bacterium]|nr:type IX secretion system protein PorQ [Chitinophagaceae bacterium]